jgi:predicted nuclease of restriction endonuclease-like (RecB) superfamily
MEGMVPRERDVAPTPAGESLPAGYVELLEALKADIRTAQVRAALAANRELIALYWRIGAAIVERQSAEGWGTGVIERLGRDLQAAFPGIEGFSPRNLWRMRAFHLAYTLDVRRDPEILTRLVAELDGANLPQAVSELPWGHNITLLQRVKDPVVRLWYARAATQHGWSRSVLSLQIDTRLHERQGQAVTNFARALPAPESDLAQQTLKDPYVFDFLTLAHDAHERDVERALTGHVEKFLLELGAGFAFVGRQVHLEIGGEDFYVDLLFYHLVLRCFVVVDLKAVPFQPEFAGKINFYCSVVDDRMRRAGDGPTIGLLLCKGKNRVVAEYALRDIHKPIGVADFETQLVASLPEELKGSLPTVEELERELGGAEAASDA